jgi:hypothetical protein
MIRVAQEAPRNTFSVTLPCTQRLTPERPWLENTNQVNATVGGMV